MSVAEVIALGPQIGPYLSAFGILLGAAAAWTTYWFFHRRTSAATWLDTFRKLYKEFWKSDEMAKMRKYLASEEEYAKLEAILTKRLASQLNTVSSEDNDVLDLVDRFCALMIRILSFGEVSTAPRQRALYQPVFNYWVTTILGRKQLMAYIERYWSPLLTRLERANR
jgi:hypothetical protein